MHQGTVGHCQHMCCCRLWSSGHPGPVALLGGQFEHVIFTINSTSWNLWGTCHVWDTGRGPLHSSSHWMCIAAQQGRTQKHAGLSTRSRLQLANHRAGARGQVCLPPNPVPLPLCQAPTSTAKRKLLDHLIQPPHSSDGETEAQEDSPQVLFWVLVTPQ